MGEEKPIRVALYIRVSTEEQTERYGLKLQEESMRAFIKSRSHLSNGAMILAGEPYIYKAGKFLPRSEWKKVEKKHRPIIDIPTFFRAKKYLEESKHEKPSGSGHIYLLSGLLKCNCCMNDGRDIQMTHWIGNRKEIKKGSGNFTYNYKCGRKNTAKSTIICPSIPLPAKEKKSILLILL